MFVIRTTFCSKYTKCIRMTRNNVEFEYSARRTRPRVPCVSVCCTINANAVPYDGSQREYNVYTCKVTRSVGHQSSADDIRENETRKAMKFAAGECVAIVTTSTNRVEYTDESEEYDKTTLDIIYWRSLIAVAVPAAAICPLNQLKL